MTEVIATNTIAMRQDMSWYRSTLSTGDNETEEYNNLS